MLAIQVEQFGDPSAMESKKIPTPSPGEDEILIRVHAAGVNPVDTSIGSGTCPSRPQLPYTPGFDVAGVVEQCVDKIKHVQPRGRACSVNSSLNRKTM